MKTIPAPHLGIQQGSEILFSDYVEGGVMWTGTGPREVRRNVTFPEPFQSDPVVLVAISMWDTDHNSNARGDLTAEDITAKGFTLVFRTWADTRVARMRASWTAFGATSDDDLWSVD